MKEEYDFSKGKRGAIVPTPAGKTRITIRLDNDIIEWFRSQVESKGGGNYQTMINSALGEYMGNRGEVFEKVIRRIIKEEIQKVVLRMGPHFRPQETAVNETHTIIDLKPESFAATSEDEIQNFVLTNLYSRRYPDA